MAMFRVNPGNVISEKTMSNLYARNEWQLATNVTKAPTAKRVYARTTNAQNSEVEVAKSVPNVNLRTTAPRSIIVTTENARNDERMEVSVQLQNNV
jgi:hypothetical protein